LGGGGGPPPFTFSTSITVNKLNAMKGGNGGAGL